MPEGWRLWLDWHKVIVPDNKVEIKALEADRGSYLGYVRLVGRRQDSVKLAAHSLCQCSTPKDLTPQRRIRQ
jgi:hypothetical protein